MANYRAEISEQNLMAYLERLTAAVGHADRHEPLRVYLEGLLLPGERKSVEPMAARIDPRNVRSRHQSMHHFVATSPLGSGRPRPDCSRLPSPLIKSDPLLLIETDPRVARGSGVEVVAFRYERV